VKRTSEKRRDRIKRLAGDLIYTMKPSSLWVPAYSVQRFIASSKIGKGQAKQKMTNKTNESKDESAVMCQHEKQPMVSSAKILKVKVFFLSLANSVRC
jgi:hypothetical protein